MTGGTDHIVRVYVCIPGPPTLQAELEEPHTVREMTPLVEILSMVGRGSWVEFVNRNYVDAINVDIGTFCGHPSYKI